MKKKKKKKNKEKVEVGAERERDAADWDCAKIWSRMSRGRWEEIQLTI